MRNLSSLLASIIIHVLIFFGFICLYQTIKIPQYKEKIISIKTIKLQESKPKPKKIIKKPKKIKKELASIKPKKVEKNFIKPKPKKIIKKLTSIKPKKIIKKIKEIKKKLTSIKPKKVFPKKIVKKTEENLTKPTLPPTPKIDLKDKYLKYNYKKILSSIKEAKFYPRRARRLHIQGDVRIKFLLKRDGSVVVKKIVSEKRFLKKAAKKTIEKASNYFPKPPENLDIEITIEYKLQK